MLCDDPRMRGRVVTGDVEIVLRGNYAVLLRALDPDPCSGDYDGSL
jgi:hypothetical protein